MDVKLHYIRDLMTNKEVQVSYCSTNTQMADIFTKCLNVQKYLQFRDSLGVNKLQSSGEIVEMRLKGGL